LGVDEHHPARFIRHHHRIRGRLQQRPEPALRGFRSLRGLNQREDLRNGEGKQYGRRDRYQSGENLNARGKHVNRNPDSNDFHEMRATAGNNERAEGQEHPVKRDVVASFVHQINKCSGNHHVRQTNEGVGNHVSPYQSWFAEVAIQVGQEIRSQNPICEGRPDQEWTDCNRQQRSYAIKHLTRGELRRFK
jgi:hypothetical protein